MDFVSKFLNLEKSFRGIPDHIEDQKGANWLFNVSSCAGVLLEQLREAILNDEVTVSSFEKPISIPTPEGVKGKFKAPLAKEILLSWEVVDLPDPSQMTNRGSNEDDGHLWHENWIRGMDLIAPHFGHPNHTMKSEGFIPLNQWKRRAEIYADISKQIADEILQPDSNNGGMQSAGEGEKKTRKEWYPGLGEIIKAGRPEGTTNKEIAAIWNRKNPNANRKCTERTVINKITKLELNKKK